MSSGLMSCVRENSPPLEMDTHTSGPLSLPESNSNMSVTDSPLTNAIAAHSHDGVHHLATSMVPTADPKAEQQKRRRFHPLRNLRRIFRRRTITSVNDTPAAAATTPQQQQQQHQHQQTLPPPNSSNSEKNLRSATLGSISSTVSASSPSSPLTHQQLLDAYSSQSLPKSKSYGCNFASKAHRDALLLAASNNNTAFKALQQQQQQQQQQQHPQQSRENQEGDSDEMYTTASTTTTSYQHQHHHAHAGYQRQSMGVAVFPSAMSRSFFTERQKLRSIGDSSQELDSSGHESGTTAGGIHRMSGGGHGSTGEMTDSQRSLSEGRLVDSDYSRDQLSQSHDSVFSESATASSLSIVLKAELADVLRKRRNRPDASDEDLGLPRSPASPQRRNEQQQHSQIANIGGASGNNNNNHTATNTPNRGNQSEVSSLSLLSMNSTDGEDGGILAASTANNSMNSSSDVMLERSTTTTSRYTRSSTISTMSSGTTSSATAELRHSMSTSSCHDGNRDEVDLFSRDWQRLSHAAAKHKMAVRPAKKKGPSRQHRRTLETAIPEANEDGFKVSNNHFLNVMDLDARAKTRSLPPGVNSKLLEQHAGDEKSKITANNNNNNTNNTTITTVNTAKSTLDSSINNNLKPQQQQSTKVDKEMTTKTKITTTTTTSSNNSSIVSVNNNNNNNSSSNTMSNMFGLRLLSAKASAIFDAKESVTEEQKNTNNNVVVAAANSNNNNNNNMTTTTTTVETTESGFLRRLIQRNSKRSIAARSNASGDDELEALQSEPKKLQISSSCYDTRPPHYDLDVEMPKSKSVTACEHNIEEKRREIKREIKSEGKSGLSAMLNNFMLAEKSIAPATTLPPTVSKPKSGPAARQRYMPQDLVDTLERKPPVEAETNSVTTVTTITSDNNSSKELLSGNRSGGSLRAKQLHSETFQSTSIIREITASQAASAKISSTSSNSSSIVAVKPEHHFEKKPKIVGLSAFQQKISRSNECFVRHSSTSNNSLEASNEMIFIGADSDEPLKQRKSVEKSRSFRTYEEERTTTTETVSNMPSLPDLSLNLRVPCFMLGENVEKGSPVQSPQHDKSVSLGFEINDNNLMRTTLRAESAKQLHVTNNNNNALLTPAQMMPQLSPTSSQNISEIEQNIDLLMKSPYVNVQLRKTSVHVDEAPAAKTPISAESAPARPKVLQLLRERAASEERLLNELSPASPTTAAVPLREKSSTNSATRASHEVHTTTTPTTPPIKEAERKSAPTSIKLTRRSSSLLERIDQPDESSTDEVPEFMKIQLNRVDPNTRAAKSNVVLAKNVKSMPSPTTPTTTPTVERVSEDVLMRRYSNESVDIHERDSSPDESPERVPCVLEAVNKQAAKTLNISGVCMSSTDLSPTKAAPSVSNSTAPECEPESPVELRSKPPKSVTNSTASNKLSLQERKRLFMHDERAKTDKRIEELRNERKKSINEELFRKSYAKSEEQLSETTTTSTMTTTVISASTSTLLTENEKEREQEKIKEIEKPKEIESLKEKEKDSSTVIMRKKSFGITGTLNGNNNNISINNNNNNTNHKSKDDPTPELMKVFARRSLKVKEEDLQAFSEKLNNSHAHSNVAYKRYSQHVPASTTAITTNTGSNSTISSATTTSTITTVQPQQQQQQQQQQSVDSDKENQSASDEKLDKLPKHDVVAIEQLSGISKMAINTSANNGNIGNGNNLNLSHNGNRNSLADFRMNAVVLGKQNGAANNTNSNNNNINNSNNNNSLTHSSTNSSTKIGSNYLPSATQRVTSNYRLSVTSNGKVHTETQHNNHNNNNNNNNNNSNSNSNSNSLRHHSTLERPALQLKSNVDIATATPIVSSSELSSKAIERSATVSEFKGIHQRRAEWEQRAKEALK